MVRAQARRRQVEHARKRGLSTRQACALLSVARSTLGYESRLEVKDTPVVEAMRQLSLQYPRFGYRRIHVMLARQGQMMSVDRAWRIWQQHGLQVPRKRPRRDPLRARHRGTVQAGERAWRAALSSLRQWSGVRIASSAALVACR